MQRVIISDVGPEMNRRSTTILYICLTASFICFGCQSPPSVPSRFQQQLALARKEGIPTTGKELSDSLPALKDSENAASYYSKLEDRQYESPPAGWKEIDELLKRDPKAAITSTSALIEKEKNDIANFEIGASLAHCNFNRNWASPEWMDHRDYGLKKAIYLISTRAALFAAQGKHELAVKDAGLLMNLAAQLREEPGQFGEIMRFTAESVGLNLLGKLAVRYQNVPEYLVKLKSSLKSASTVNPKNVLKTELIEIITLIDYVESKAGRERWRITDHEYSEALKMPIPQSKDEGKALIVEGFRKRWASAKEPYDEAEITKGNDMIKQGAKSFVIAEHFLSEGFQPELIQQMSASYVARIRVLETLILALNKKLPNELKEKAQLSPIDKKPIRYQVSNGKISIRATDTDSIFNFTTPMP